jgi:hypothetical protein
MKEPRLILLSLGVMVAFSLIGPAVTTTTGAARVATTRTVSSVPAVRPRFVWSRPAPSTPVTETPSLHRSSPAKVSSPVSQTATAEGGGSSDATSTNTADWACIRRLESGGSYTIGGDEPYGGAYQAAVSTWQGLGFSGVPNAASPAVQDEFALKLYAWDLKYRGNGFAAWETAPMCGL